MPGKGEIYLVTGGAGFIVCLELATGFPVMQETPTDVCFNRALIFRNAFMI